MDNTKKPRHRHSPAQLAALNDLYDQHEHPPLDQRTALAQRLGMETKTVNAWFQNKRASSKKRARGAPFDQHATAAPHPLQNNSMSSSSDIPSFLEPFEYVVDDDYSASMENVSSFYAGNPDHTHFLPDSDNMPRRMRQRPSQYQTDELRKLYNLNPHATTEQRQYLADRIGMRYQSITNWFQNQRSLAKKRKEDDADAVLLTPPSHPSMVDYANENIRTYSAFPPPSNHPSLGLPPQPVYPSHPHPSHAQVMSYRSLSVSPSLDERSPRRSSSRRSSTPYGTFSRPRRSRPEPYQLDALKDLFTKTATPSIEERSALALEIGMDVGKVTNWFRNLRQTARKRSKRNGSGDEFEDDNFAHAFSAYASRSGTPSLRSPSPSASRTDSMDLDDYDLDLSHRRMLSDLGSEDDYQEAVTPSPDTSPSPPPSTASQERLPVGGSLSVSLALDPTTYSGLDKASAARYKDIRVEDALLLLSFHQHIVH